MHLSKLVKQTLKILWRFMIELACSGKWGLGSLDEYPNYVTLVPFDFPQASPELLAEMAAAHKCYAEERWAMLSVRTKPSKRKNNMILHD